jgi:hypothetical protein
MRTLHFLVPALLLLAASAEPAKGQVAGGTRLVMDAKGAARVAKEKGLYIPKHTQKLGYVTGLRQRAQVFYVVHEPYPAKQLLKEIESSLKGGSWKPLKEDWLNPGMPSSLVSGWSDHGDGTSGTLMHVWIWTAQWENANGVLIEYTLRYVRPWRAKDDLSDVRVNASWLSAAEARATRDTIPKAR